MAAGAATVGHRQQLPRGVHDRVLVGAEDPEQAVDQGDSYLGAALAAKHAGHRLGDVPAQDLGFVGVRHRCAWGVDVPRLVEALLQMSRDEALVDTLEQTSPVCGHRRQLAIERSARRRARPRRPGRFGRVDAARPPSRERVPSRRRVGLLDPRDGRPLGHDRLLGNEQADDARRRTPPRRRRPCRPVPRRAAGRRTTSAPSPTNQVARTPSRVRCLLRQEWKQHLGHHGHRPRIAASMRSGRGRTAYSSPWA